MYILWKCVSINERFSGKSQTFRCIYGSIRKKSFYTFFRFLCWLIVWREQLKNFKLVKGFSYSKLATALRARQKRDHSSLRLGSTSGKTILLCYKPFFTWAVKFVCATTVIHLASHVHACFRFRYSSLVLFKIWKICKIICFKELLNC